MQGNNQLVGFGVLLKDTSALAGAGAGDLTSNLSVARHPARLPDTHLLSYCCG